MDWLDIAAIVFGGGGMLTFFWNLLNRKDTRAKSAAETNKANAEAIEIEARAYEQMQETISNMEERFTTLRKERDEDREIIDQLQADIRVLKREQIENDVLIKRLQRTIQIYRYGVNELIKQLRGLNIPPSWEPPADETI